ncbi:serine/arginine repetitive matrix protein 2-like [Cocos nucifera]|uniref:Serine/arginine repetitive matrix protein 2-like n=1 Tax=Cocos nucifera TaxID=13894 RepID=A0A8K0IT91_COCNU|nr:serine/arginine repetitive matrix protein 2-like [Cocos nucifera]
MLSQNAHQVPQQMPPPPRMFPPPPPPSQGQVLYRTSPPPPMGIQHVPAPPPPPPSNFVSITPAPFVPFGSTSLGDAQPPSLPPPPPPPPPASPPPIPPSPTPPAPPMEELPTVPEAPSVDSGADRNCSFEHVTTDDPVTLAQSIDDAPVSGSSHIGEVDNARKKVPLVEREVSGDLPPPPKPIEEEVVRNIEVLCQFIAKVGPEFENLARTNEVGNPKFAFLFGGAPGSAAAVGYEYFQWMKGKCRFEMESHKDPERPSEMENSLQSGNLENEVAVRSPSVSDMDMEDDVGLHGGDVGLVKSNAELTGESASLSNIGYRTIDECGFLIKDVNECKDMSLGPKTNSTNNVEIRHAQREKRRQIINLILFSDDKDSSFIEDVSPVRPLPSASECAIDGNLQESVRPLTQASSWVNVMPTAACGKTAETPRVFVKDGSPFRLIQGYASDDSGEDDDKKDYVDSINPVMTSPSAAVSSSGLQKDKGYEMPSNFSPKSVPETEKARLCTDSSHLLKEAATFGSSSPQKSAQPDVVFSNPVDAIENVTDLSIHKQHDQILHGNHKLSKDIDVVGDKSIDVDHQVTQIHMEDANQDSTAPNVDEFGRLVREGVSDSDSEGIDYNERHGKRVRGWSRSRSPQLSRWRQRSRSPRRRDKRSRSRSWSPRRSKSPLAYRRTTLFARADRDQPPECFNFIRGRCFRGASCRFLHRDVGYHRRRQPHCKDFAQGSDNYDAHDDALVSENSHHAKSSVRNMDVEKCDDVDLEATKSLKMQTDEKLSKASTKITHDGVVGKKVAVDTVTADALPSLKNDAGERQITDHCSQNIVSQVKEPQQLEILQKAPKINGAEEERTQPLLESSQSSPAQKSECLISETVLGQPNTEGQAIQAGAFQNQVPSIWPYSEHALVSQTCQSESSVSHSHSNCGLASQPWNQRLLPDEFLPPRVSVTDTKSQPSQLLPPAPQGHPPPFFPADGTSAPCASEHPRENLLPPVTSYHLHRPPMDMSTSHQPPVASDYHSQSMHPSNSMWPNPPLPPPSYGLPSRPAFPATEFSRMQFQQNSIPPRNDFSQPSIRPYTPGELTGSQAVDFHRQPFQSMEPSHHPPLHTVEFKWRPLPMGNQQNQPFPREDWLSCPPPMPEGSRIISDLRQKDYHLHHQSLLHDDVRIPFPSQGPSSSKSYSQSSAVFPPALSNRSESFPGDHLPPRFFSKEEFRSVSNMPYSHPPYGQQRSASPNFPSNMGGPGMTNPSLQRLSLSFSESNLPHQLSDIGAPKISIPTHYNPFASTFEEAPGSLKFGSSKYDSLFSSSHDPLGGSGSRLKASPPNLRRSGEQFLPRSGGYSHETSAEALPDAHNQFVRDPASGLPYDPLFDSIETSSNMLKKLDHVQEHNLAANDAGMVPKINSLTRPADVEDSNRQKDGMGAELKSEADEFGEVATDAEAGAVENESPQQVDGKNWSPVIPLEVGNTAAGEIEIDQVRSPGKKKSKESRSMKLLKIALADFVKEVLKPSWRQGNMSKEAFKTIVKKTVDKVSGAIPSHQIPKTQAKINQYVESSQRKLTKLVMVFSLLSFVFY